jgi:eukaryotic-like serine/threonine-protein kinase
MDEPLRLRVKALFAQAADLPREEREAFLDSACRDEPDLRAKVERLLAYDAGFEDGKEEPGFLKSPVVRAPEKTPSESASPPQREEAGVPARIGPYRILRRHGEGGMGIVYEAEQDNPRRTVALKVIRPGWVSPELVHRFSHEAQILGRLQHVGIAQIHEAGMGADGQPFFAMEFIRGMPLDEYVRTRRPDTAARLELLAKVCDAVQHAHDKGVIHRDLKPGNILVDESGQPKVLDFGVAHVTTADLLATSSRTQTGQLLGTLSYMSPEQIAAHPTALDERSDVYTLGVILFELLADRLPYHLEQLPMHEVARVIQNHEPLRLGSIDARYRGDVEIIVAKSLEKDKARRYAAAGDLASDIRSYLRGEAIRARPASALYQLRKLARRHKALVGGVLGVMAALAAGAMVSLLYAIRAERNAREARYQTYRARLAVAVAALAKYDVADTAHQLDEAPPELRAWEWDHLHSRLDDSFAVLQQPADSPIFLLNGPRGLSVGATTAGSVRVNDSDGRESLRFPLGTERLASLVATPGGVRAVVFAGDRLVRLRDEAGRVQAVLDAAESVVPGVATVSTDGMRVAIVWGTSPRGRDVVDIYETASGKRRAACGGHEGGVWKLAFSPDGRQLASCGEDNLARVWDASTGALTVAMRGHTSKVLHVAFRPDGARLLTASADGTVRQWDVTNGREVEPPYERHTGEVRVAIFSPDGRFIASAGSDRVVRIWEAAGRSDVAVLRGHDRDVSELAFSTDGRRLASASPGFALGHRGDGSVRFWEVEPGADPRVLGGHTSYVYPVAYSPDGRWIASGSWDHTVRLWDARTGETCAVLRHPDVVLSLAFGPDSSWLVTGCDQDKNYRIWSLATAEVRELIPGPGDRLRRVAVSPDGRRLAVHDLKGNLRIHDVATHRTVASGEGSVPAYSPDGRWLAGYGHDQKVLCLWEAQTLRLIAQFTGHTGGIQSVAFSPDGRRLVSAGGDRTVRVWDVTTGQGRALEGHTDEVYAAVFHPSGARVASGGRDRAIWLWDLTTGHEVARLEGHTNYVYSLAFSPDGRSLVSGSGDGTVRLWDTEPLARRQQARRESEALRPEADRLVERLFDKLRDPDQVFAHLRADEALSDSIRQAALQAVMRRGHAAPRKL